MVTLEKRRRAAGQGWEPVEGCGAAPGVRAVDGEPSSCRVRFLPESRPERELEVPEDGGVDGRACPAEPVEDNGCRVKVNPASDQAAGAPEPAEAEAAAVWRELPGAGVLGVEMLRAQ